MKLTSDQFIDAAFIFEKENGYKHSQYEKDVIEKSDLKSVDVLYLKTCIVNGLNSNIYEDVTLRVSAYWALSKTNDKSLIPEFKNWLKNELIEKNSASVFQILIALDRFEEPAFHKERNSRYFDDTELNFRDAKNYLAKN